MPDYDIINFGSVDTGYRQLCAKCFNTEVAESDGLDKFEHADFAPVELTDCDSQAHVLHFRTRLFGPVWPWMLSRFAMDIQPAINFR
jgi:hypothetical protein